MADASALCTMFKQGTFWLPETMAPEKQRTNYSGISKILDERGKTQTWLSNETGIPRANINRYATASIKKPNMAALEKMAAALGVKVEEMVEIEESAPEEAVHLSLIHI